MDAFQSTSGDSKRNLEYDFLSLTYQISHLLECRAREREALNEMSRLIEALARAQRQPIPNEERRKLNQITEAVLAESESVVQLSLQTSSYRDQFRVLQSQLSEIGHLLGYW